MTKENIINPNISMHILHTVLYTFSKVLTRRIYWMIKSFFRWWSFPLFLWLLFGILWWCFNPLIPRSDEHVTSPYDLQTFSSKKGNENTQTHQGKVITLIKNQIPVTNLQENQWQP